MQFYFSLEDVYILITLKQICSRFRTYNFCDVFYYPYLCLFQISQFHIQVAVEGLLKLSNFICPLRSFSTISYTSLVFLWAFNPTCGLFLFLHYSLFSQSHQNILLITCSINFHPFSNLYLAKFKGQCYIYYFSLLLV